VDGSKVVPVDESSSLVLWLIMTLSSSRCTIELSLHHAQETQPGKRAVASQLYDVNPSRPSEVVCVDNLETLLPITSFGYRTKNGIIDALKRPCCAVGGRLVRFVSVHC
jgi:hypothetical protein